MMKRNNNINDNFQGYNNPTIKFMRRKIKYRCILLLKILGLTSITVITSVVIIFMIFNNKYKSLTDKNNVDVDRNISNRDYSIAIDNVKNSLVTIGSSKDSLSINEYVEGNSTGVIIQESGRILANYSMIKDLEKIYVNLSFVGSEALEAKVIYTNKYNDIAILEVDYNEELTPIKTMGMDEIIEGEKVLLISNSTSDEYIDNLIPGVITSTNRHLEVEDEKYNLFEVNTPINKFNTGGIISNLKGEVIGISSKEITDTMNVNGLYYAIDLRSLETIIDYTNEIKDILGIIEGDFTKDNTNDYSGFYVAVLNKDKSSDKVGLRSTDIILEINNIKIGNIAKILEMLKNKKNGDTVTCKVMRSGEITDINITLSNFKK